MDRIDTRVAQRVALATFALTLLCAPTPADASPWVLRKHTLVVGLNATAQLARNEFLSGSGKRQPYPLNGRFESYSIGLGARYGLGYNIELSLRTELKGVSFVSDPVLLPGDPAPTDLAGYRSSVFNFSGRAIGLGDVFFGVTYAHLRGGLRLASYLEVKIPTGYRSPRATFANNQPNPEEITDDVTLGDGQVDLMYQVQLGYVIRPTRTLLELDLGYKVRFNGPGHQLVGQFKVGQFLGKHVLLYAAVEGAYTLFEGDVIGQTFVAVDPRAPARDWPDNNVQPIDYRLDRDFLTVGGGVLLRVGRPNFVLRVAHTPLGRNYAQLTAISLGMLVSFG
ncbi:MAG: hypothetical protein KC503_40385 [Myxococcales bacterium]|nr:hypothetical protein [Myxococcales bacterium]